MLFNSAMKSIDDIRRENLQVLERQFGSLRGLADVLDRSESQVSQWKNGAVNSGTGKPRGMRTETARFIEDGDILLVDTGRKDPSMADGVYVLGTSKRLFIKRVTERFDGSRMVSSDNKNVPLVQELNGDCEIEVLGRVVWAWNGRKL
jgi:hypothetical protein